VISAANLKRISLVADKFFRKLSQEFEEGLLKDFLKNTKQTDEPEVDDYLDEMIEYDDTVEMLEDEEWSEDKAEDKLVEEVALPKETKPDTPRKYVKGQSSRKCELCGIVCSSTQRLRNHIRVRHQIVADSEKIPCKICGKKFKIQEYLDHHIKNQHTGAPQKPREKYPCSMCGKFLSSVPALKNHEERHTIELMSPEEMNKNIKKFVCDLCGLRFRLKSYVFNHIENVHIRTKYPCVLCPEGFYKKYEMKDHIRRYHTMETPYACDFKGCEKKFARKKNLKIHIVSGSVGLFRDLFTNFNFLQQRIHTGERPYACTYEFCEKRFMHFIDKKRHMISHTGIKPHNCHVCQRGFMRKNELKSHMRTHYTQIS
jgi:uncharacterized Zn-finger protein